ncbi:MAG: GspE/PulE family protein [Verrucomicrobiota bacterium]
MLHLVKDAALQAGCVSGTELSAIIDGFEPGGGSVIHQIIDAELVDERRFLRQLAHVFGLEFWEGFQDINQELAISLRQSFPVELARKRNVVPVHLAEGQSGGTVLYLAATDPLELDLHSLVSRECEMPFRWAVATKQTVKESQHVLYGVGDDSLDELIESRLADSEELGDWEEAMIIDDGGDDTASVISFVNEIIRGALDQDGTDIHLEPLGRDLRIRYRIDGKLKEVPTPENMGSLQSSVISRIKIMAGLDIAERRLPQDGRIHLELDGNPIDVRVATIPSVEGESVSLRILGQETLTLDRLGMDPRMLGTMRNLLEMPNGIILVTGPTGSGKSTSLYAFLQEINRPDSRIVTIEDPVENKLEGVVQIAVKNDIGLTFAQGLRSILRGDPNVIMVGEIRDVETADIAIRAALTGHLVFSTLHTNDALSGVMRLVDMGVEPFLVASSVRAFVAQRLVRRLCPHCREPYQISETVLRENGWLGEIPRGQIPTMYRAKGCNQCRGTGYRGRLAIYELATITEQMGELISRRSPMAELQQQAEADGYVPMRVYGIAKCLAGETSLEEVLSATMSPGAMNEAALTTALPA